MNSLFRQKKENQRSVRTTKLCSATCLGFGLILVSTLASFYWDLYQRSVLYDQGNLKADNLSTNDSISLQLKPPSVLAAAADGKLVYDNCGDPVPVDETTVQMNTSWTFAFRFNAIFYTLATGMVICSCLGLIFTRIFNATLNCLILAMFVHVAVIVVAGVY